MKVKFFSLYHIRCFLKDHKRELLLVTMILLVALILRLWSIDFGLPDLHIIDEGEVVYSAFYSGYNWIQPDASFRVAEGVEYVVLSNWAIKQDIANKFIQSFHTNYKLIKSFNPSYNFDDDPHFIRTDYDVLDSVRILTKNKLFGPSIEIYQISSKDKFDG